MSQEQDLQNKSSNDALLKVASQLLEQAGVNKDDFYSAISALTTAKQQNPKVKRVKIKRIMLIRHLFMMM